MQVVDGLFLLEDGACCGVGALVVGGEGPRGPGSVGGRVWKRGAQVVSGPEPGAA